jgi:hypothetical protein
VQRGGLGRAAPLHHVLDLRHHRLCAQVLLVRLRMQALQSKTSAPRSFLPVCACRHFSQSPLRPGPSCPSARSRMHACQVRLFPEVSEPCGSQAGEMHRQAAWVVRGQDMDRGMQMSTSLAIVHGTIIGAAGAALYREGRQRRQQLLKQCLVGKGAPGHQ